MSRNGKLPLEGVRVLDLTHRLAGPTLTMVLGDWGADVLKIEWWYRMDAWRGMISIEHDKSGQQTYNKKPNWLKLNRSKRSITLNLKSEKGKGIFLDLVKQSDIVADNFSAGVLDRLGLGYDVLSRVNPRIIRISMPGFGDHGPHADFVSNGATIEGYAGLASLTGYEDGVPRNSVGIWPDPVAGMSGAVAVAMALMWREISGRGQYIELSQAEALASMIGDAILDCSVNGRVQGPMGNRDIAMAPHGCYPCRGEDSWITIAVGTDEEWKALCRAARRPSWLKDARFQDQAERWKNRQVLDGMLAGWTQKHDAWELSERLQKAGVAATPVATQEDFLNNPELPACGFYQEIGHPYLKRYPGPAARLDGGPLPLKLPPPMLGEHNYEVYGSLLGLSREEIDRLHQEDVI